MLSVGDPVKPLLESVVTGDGRWRRFGLRDGREGWLHTTAAGPAPVEL